MEKKKIAGRRGNKTQRKRLKKNHWKLAQTLLFSLFAEEVGVINRDDKIVFDKLDRIKTDLADIEIALERRKFAHVSKELVDILTVIYKDVVAGTISREKLREEVSHLFKIAVGGLTKSGLDDFCPRSDRVKNLLGPKRCALTLVADSFGISRSQMEYNYKLAQRASQKRLLIGFVDFNLVCSTQFLKLIVSRVFDVKYNRATNAAVSRIYRYHLRKRLEVSQFPITEWELDQTFKRNCTNWEFFFFFANKSRHRSDFRFL